MPHLSQASYCLAALLAIGGPLAVIWKAQNRAAESLRTPPAAVADTPVFNGFPYLFVPKDKLGARQPVTAFEEIVRRQSEEFGPSHPDTLISRNNLANALLAEGRCADAETAQRDLLADMKQYLAAGHPDTFRCQFNLALNLRMQGKQREALAEMEAVYAGWRSVLGETHPRTQEAMLVLENLRQPLPLHTN